MPPAKKQKSAAERIPDRPTLVSVRDAARDCRACDLWKLGTQMVFGEGTRRAEIMLVGEQPGDQEDISGHPFVGPAGKMLDRALAEAGIDRGTVYVTNVVKHFKWEPRGKRRIHKKPNSAEITACRPWLETEIELVKPRALVCRRCSAPPSRSRRIAASSSLRRSRRSCWRRCTRHRCCARPMKRRGGRRPRGSSRTCAPS
jgi:uracil-DNA glycosylase family protein